MSEQDEAQEIIKRLCQRGWNLQLHFTAGKQRPSDPFSILAKYDHVSSSEVYRKRNQSLLGLLVRVELETLSLRPQK